MNYSFRKKNKTVKYIIIHYTGMKDLKSAFSKLHNLKSNVSVHYLISRSGFIFNLLCPKFIAWHAGKSQWKNDKNLNDYSIGIELENKGHDYSYEYFTSKQYISLKKLVNFLINNLRIEQQNIIFHSDISPNRKKDPGEKFFINKIGIKRFKQTHLKKRTYSINALLKIYGFSNYYIKKYPSKCILSVKRSLNYKKVNSHIGKKFKLDFYNLLIK